MPIHHAIHADCLLPDTGRAWFCILIYKEPQFPCSVFIIIVTITNVVYWFMHTTYRFNGFLELAPTIQTRIFSGWPSNHTISRSYLTHCGLAMSYVDIDLGQHITWTNVNLSPVRSSDNRLRAIAQEAPQLPITKISSKISLKSPS